MRPRLAILIIVLSPFLIGISVAHGASTITQVTHNAYEDTFPHMRDNCLVWQGYVNGNYQIFYYDIAAEVEPVQVSNDPYDHLNPQTDGRYIVWWTDKASSAEIWLYDTQTQLETQISPADDKQYYLPVIANARAAWMGFVPGESIIRDIFLFDPSNGLRQLTDDDLDNSAPRINGTELIWVQTDELDNSTLFVHDLATGETSEAPAGYSWEDSPQCDGFLRVLTRYDQHDWEIILRNEYLKGFKAITDNTLDDGHPCISGDHVAWMAGGEIFLAGLPLIVKAATNVRQRSFTANWQGPAEGADSYRLDVSTTRDFSSYVAGYHDRNVGNSTSYAVTGLHPNTMYCYRVRAVLSNAISESSDTIIVKTAAAKPSLAGVLFLLLSSDRDSGTFGFSH